MPSRVFLHVGSPKTGTTFLQNVLWSQRRRAREQGLLLPLRSFDDHFRATVEVRELIGRQPRYRDIEPGVWSAMVHEAESWDGTALISHELFAGATYAQAEKAVGAFAPDTDVHVVVTARDLLRQLPAEWQEHIKHRYRQDFRNFLDEIERDPGHESWFWRVQDAPDVLDRWGHLLPRSNVHVITVPAAGADPTLLWRRFAALLDLDPETFDLGQPRSNPSLGTEQTEVLRRFNVALGARLEMGAGYPGVAKEVLAHQVLGARPGTPLRLVGPDREFAVRRSRVAVAALRHLDVQVVGDLDELVPVPVDASAVVPLEMPESRILDETLEALIGLAEHHKTARDQLAAYRHQTREQQREIAELRPLTGRVDFLQSEIDQLHHDMRHRPVRHMLVGMSERWRAVMALRMGFHRCANALRGGWSRLRDAIR